MASKLNTFSLKAFLQVSNIFGVNFLFVYLSYCDDVTLATLSQSSLASYCPRRKLREYLQLHIWIADVLQMSKRGLAVQHVELIAKHHRFERVRFILVRFYQRGAQIGFRA